MTLIASFNYKDNESLFLLGDGLISSTEKSDGNFIMPGAGKVGRPRNKDGLYFDGIAQKVNVLGPDLAFVWSGRMDLAVKFASELYLVYSSDDYDFGKLKPFLDGWPQTLSDEDRPQIRLICMAHVDSQYKCWHFGVDDLSGYKHFSRLWISGSGRDSFLEVVGCEDDHVASDEQAVGHAMNLLNKFYHDDLFDKSNYGEAFGGFYELAACYETGIEKLSDTLITSMLIKADRPEEWGVPVTFLKYDVFRGLAVVREIRATEKEGKPDVKNYGHIYPPIVGEVRQEAIEAIKLLQDEGSAFDSKYIGSVDARHTLFMLRLEDDKHVLKVPLFYRKPKRDGPVTVSLREGQLRLDYSPQLCNDIRRIVRKNVDTSTGKLIIGK